jgi:hypothetical protein
MAVFNLVHRAFISLIVLMVMSVAVVCLFVHAPIRTTILPYRPNGRTRCCGSSNLEGVPRLRPRRGGTLTPLSQTPGG